ncbi:MAG: fasciclin domain-containing protein [Candidatus Promineofilum sp.]|nr:fasciclin domain-containing protein [Promineifilum sp.]
MARYHTKEEIRRYDLMKLGVLLLLSLLLGLTWIVTRDLSPLPLAGDEAAGTPVVEGIENGEDVAMPMPTLGVPSIDPFPESPPAGSVMLSGTAGPGAQIVILVNGAVAGAASAGVDGNWSATVDLAAGDYTIQAQTIDNVGSVVGESQPVAVTVGGDADLTPAVGLNPPGFDALTGRYIFAGTTAPGTAVTITSNGTVVGTGLADDAGNFVVAVGVEAITGDVVLQTTDAGGTVTQQSEPLKLGAQPPSLDPPADMTTDPDNAAIAVPGQSDALALTGRGAPGTQVELLIDGQSAGSAVVDVEGRWATSLPLAAGPHTLQLNTLDPGGNLLSSATPITLTVGDVAAAATEPATPTGGAAETGEQTIAGLLAARPEFSTLASILGTSEVASLLAGSDPLTLFAPTNEAFDLLPQRVIDGLTANPEALSAVIQYHLARGRHTLADLQVVQPATLNGRLLTVGSRDGRPTINDAIITEADTPAANGIIHAINRVLVPPLAEGVRLPLIDDSGVATFTGSSLTIVGTAEPNRTILVELNGEPFGEATVVNPEGQWSVSGDVTPGDYQIVAYMLRASDALEAISRPLALSVRSE